ncbi:hypothetical protein K1X84_05160 [bacterium]|nr:hypothetical protein [bacterium]
MKIRFKHFSGLFLGFFLWVGVNQVYAASEASLKPTSPLADINYISFDHTYDHFFISSQKEDLTTQWSNQKFKFNAPPNWHCGQLSYKTFRFIYKSLIIHTFILGDTPSLRAPPSFLLS